MGLYNVINRTEMQQGLPQDISDVLANFDAIAAVLNGNIDSTNILDGSITNADIATAAAIAISKLQGYPTDGTKALFGDATWKVPTAGTLIGVQVFTASGTYTPTAGMGKCYAEGIGSGAGGGGGAASTDQSADSGGGGGGSGAYSAAFLTAAQIGASKAITIGAAGNGGAAGNNAGSAGGDVSLGSLLVAKGGSGGAGSAAGNGGTPAGGAGGLASGGTGDIKLNGGTGGIGIQNVNNPTGGEGASAPILHGEPGHVRTPARGSTGSMAGENATGIGAGGSGAAVTGGGGAAAGGNGATGLIRVWEFA